jgi:hypothetical protein
VGRGSATSRGVAMRSVIRSSRVLALVILAACGGGSAKSSPSPDGQAMLQTGNSTKSLQGENHDSIE